MIYVAVSLGEWFLAFLKNIMPSTYQEPLTQWLSITSQEAESSAAALWGSYILQIPNIDNV
jgi:hypothetical protein